MAEPDTTTLPTPIPTSLNVTALAKRFGLARSTIRRRLSKGWVPPATVERVSAARANALATVPVNAPVDRPPAAPFSAPLTLQRPVAIEVERAAPTNGRGTGLILMGTATAIAALAITINAQTGWRFGTTPLAAVTFAGLSIADVLAIVLPSAAVAFSWNRRWALSMGAWLTWALAASMATLASVGFASLHISDTAAARAAIVTTAAETTNQRNAAIEAAKAAAQAATVARQAECQRRGPKCRDLEHAEQARMSELQAAIATPVPTAPAIADADPQVTGAVRLASWAGLNLTAVDVGNLRLAMMGLLPNLAGLVMAFGVALRSDGGRS